METPSNAYRMKISNFNNTFAPGYFIYDTGAMGGLYVSHQPVIDNLVPDWRTRVNNVHGGASLGVGGNVPTVTFEDVIVNVYPQYFNGDVFGHLKYQRYQFRTDVTILLDPNHMNPPRQLRPNGTTNNNLIGEAVIKQLPVHVKFLATNQNNPIVL